jgi:tetratricopeptide (TPR) repeat protein
MSLLLEALKKAEKAKEEAQRRASDDSASAGLRLQEDPPASDNKAVTTRRELPDISQPLEILSDDITPRARPAVAASAPRATPSAPQPKGRLPAAEQAAERTAARKVFEAKFNEPNPRLPFYLAMGALGVAATCTVVYFWYQLRPPQSLVNTSPPPAGERSVASANPATAETTQPIVGLPVAAATAAIPGLPGTSVQPLAPPAPAARPAAAKAAAAVRAPEARPAVPARPLTGLQSLARAQSAAEVDPGPATSRQAAQIHPKVESAYEAFLAGDIARARNDYQDALRDEPANRDALLGLAAADVRSGRLEAAEAIYVRLLRADPRDAHAQSGLIALRSARMDPLIAESRVKTLLAADPEAHVLNFTLGNQLAQQGRWGEAQQQYFKAFVAEPDNPDFAYNVAVSLDHLRQPKLALEYYRRALALAATRGASFDAAAARERITELGN